MIRTHLRHSAAGVLLAAVSLAAFALLPEPPPARVAALRAHVEVLAGKDMGGRGSGTPGNARAARYIAAEFRRLGLKPLGTSRQEDPAAPMDGSGYFQPFTFSAGVTRGTGNTLRAILAGKTEKHRAGTEFVPSGVSARGSAEGDAVFVGYGIDARDPVRNDYGGLDVQGRIVVMLAGAPATDPHSPLMEHAGIRRKAIAARDRGAAGILVALPKDSDVPETQADGNSTDSGLPIHVIRRSLLERWMRAAGRDLAGVEAALKDGPLPLALPVRIVMTTDVRKVTRTTANVAGLLPGSDPALRDEVVVIGAHMDHLGSGGPGSLAESRAPAIHHGADDNASGTAGVLELAASFSAMEPRPRRSLLFLCFSGEELGLLGSAHYVKNPLVPMERTVAMLNMDMIGRMQNKRLIVGGSGTSPSWEGLLKELEQGAGFTMTRSDSGFGASDHQSFYLQKVPVLFFFTGLHSDYHKPTDTAEKINYADQALVVDLVGRCAAQIASMPDRPPYRAMQATAAQPSRGFRASLGTIPDYAAEVEGVMLSGVRPGSPAEKAGLRQGDVIVKFGGRSVRSVQEYTAVLGEHKPGDEVEIVVKRGTEMVTLKAVLAAPSR